MTARAERNRLLFVVYVFLYVNFRKMLFFTHLSASYADVPGLSYSGRNFVLDRPLSRHETQPTHQLVFYEYPENYRSDRARGCSVRIFCVFHKTKIDFQTRYRPTVSIVLSLIPFLYQNLFLAPPSKLFNFINYFSSNKSRLFTLFETYKPNKNRIYLHRHAAPSQTS